MGKATAYSYIRFSSREQERGDSLRRQTDTAEQYVSKHNLILDRTLYLRDLGISGFKGKNRREGALKTFLDAVESGLVKKGSYLLVENIDRLSREDVVTAQVNFLDLVQRGIRIVTLLDRRIYDLETFKKEPSALYMLIGSIHRAHEESQLKSDRVGKAWEQKRKQIHEKPLTRKCPSWLRFDEENECFIQIPERVAVIERIFKLHSKGYGRRMIARKLNEEGVENWSKSTFWQGIPQSLYENRAFHRSKFSNQRKTV